MNEYVQKYLEKKNEQKKEELQQKLYKVMNNLRIGEREYPENSDYNLEDYPYWDNDKKKYYRYNAGEVTEDEFNMLVQYDVSGKEQKHVEKAERSGWYTFATVMMVLGGLAVLVTLLIAISDSYNPNWIPFIVTLVSYLFELGFWATVQLLAGIKQGLDNLQNK